MINYKWEADPPGFEPGTFGLGVRCPIQARLRAPIVRNFFWGEADPPGFEPGTFGLEVRRPIQARLRALLLDKKNVNL